MNYIKITRYDTANGPGIRTVLWLSGCIHRCKGCHNPETWNPKVGSEFTQEVIDEVLDSISPEYISGLTISGGDPLYYGNISGVANLVSQMRSKYPNKSIWVYTGYTLEEIDNALIKIHHNEDATEEDLTLVRDTVKIISNIDVLVDGEYVESLRDITLPYCGSTNQRVIDVKKTLASDRIVEVD